MWQTIFLLRIQFGACLDFIFTRLSNLVTFLYFLYSRTHSRVQETALDNHQPASATKLQARSHKLSAHHRRPKQDACVDKRRK
jgi:hypothetical protein